MSREPIEIVEIDVPRCSRTYGVAPCTAALGITGTRKCFNTRATCQDPANFNLGTPLTLSFSRESLPLPKGTQAFPTIVDIGQSTTTVNIAGTRPGYSSLGRRAELTVEMMDFLWSDRGTDPYRSGRVDGSAQVDEPGYDPQSRGSFWPKLKARWPNYSKANIRLKRGYLVDGLLVDVTTYHYVLREVAGPSQGKVTLRAVGILDLANEKTALCPKPSPGALSANITNSATSFSVTPSGAGASYPTSGRVCVGSEVMSFTRSGDTFTVTRAQRGTSAAAHSAADAVQLVYSVDGARLDDTAKDLLENYADVPTATIPFTDWQAEVTRWGGSILLRTDVCQPTPVATLLSELGDLGCTIVEDLRNNQILLRMNRPVDGETVYTVTDRNMKSIKHEDRDTDRLTQVLFCHKRADVTKQLTEENNYSRRLLSVEQDALELYGETRTLRVYTRWLDQGDDTTAIIVSSRLLQRFKSAPMTVHLLLDASMKDIDLMDVVSLTTEDMTDPTGASTIKLMQVISRQEPIPYHDVMVELQRFDFSRRYGFIAPDATPVYGSASPAQKLAYGFISDGSNAFSDGSEPYRII